MNIAQLKETLKDLPDDMPVKVLSGEYLRSPFIFESRMIDDGFNRKIQAYEDVDYPPDKVTDCLIISN